MKNERGAGILAVGLCVERARCVRPICFAVVLAAGSAMVGCSSSSHSRDVSAAPMPARWEAVFLPDATREAIEQRAVGNDDAFVALEARNDVRVGVRGSGAVSAATDWPAPPRLTLDRSRTFTLPKQPESVIYPRPERRPFDAGR